MSAPFQFGNPVRLTASVTAILRPGGQLESADPSVVVFVLTTPAGQETSLAGVRDSVGRYHADYMPTDVGTYQYYSTGTGSVITRSPVATFQVVNQRT